MNNFFFSSCHNDSDIDHFCNEHLKNLRKSEVQDYLNLQYKIFNVCIDTISCHHYILQYIFALKPYELKKLYEYSTDLPLIEIRLPIVVNENDRVGLICPWAADQIGSYVWTETENFDREIMKYSNFLLDKLHRQMSYGEFEPKKSKNNYHTRTRRTLHIKRVSERKVFPQFEKLCANEQRIFARRRRTTSLPFDSQRHRVLWMSKETLQSIAITGQSRTFSCMSQLSSFIKDAKQQKCYVTKDEIKQKNGTLKPVLKGLKITDLPRLLVDDMVESELYKSSFFQLFFQHLNQEHSRETVRSQFPSQVDSPQYRTALIELISSLMVSFKYEVLVRKTRRGRTKVFVDGAGPEENVTKLLNDVSMVRHQKKHGKYLVTLSNLWSSLSSSFTRKSLQYQQSKGLLSAHDLYLAERHYLKSGDNKKNDNNGDKRRENMHRLASTYSAWQSFYDRQNHIYTYLRWTNWTKINYIDPTYNCSEHASDTRLCYKISAYRFGDCYLRYVFPVTHRDLTQSSLVLNKFLQSSDNYRTKNFQYDSVLFNAYSLYGVPCSVLTSLMAKKEYTHRLKTQYPFTHYSQRLKSVLYAAIRAVSDRIEYTNFYCCSDRERKELFTNVSRIHDLSTRINTHKVKGKIDGDSYYYMVGDSILLPCRSSRTSAQSIGIWQIANNSNIHYMKSDFIITSNGVKNTLPNHPIYLWNADETGHIKRRMKNRIKKLNGEFLYIKSVLSYHSGSYKCYRKCEYDNCEHLMSSFKIYILSYQQAKEAFGNNDLLSDYFRENSNRFNSMFRQLDNEQHYKSFESITARHYNAPKEMIDKHSSVMISQSRKYVINTDKLMSIWFVFNLGIVLVVILICNDPKFRKSLI
ncbi:hypothetical protein SNEBB_002349 [Seison nebaliae]|nr:hypothetical protein SNEBB_002349 [Seison nebaliae]